MRLCRFANDVNRSVIKKRPPIFAHTAASRFSSNRPLHLLLIFYALVWITLAIKPRDWLTWTLENLLVLVFVGALAATYRRFAFSNFSYLLITIFLSVHALGAHTGYAHAPAGDWLRSILQLHRNPYDRVGHCAFGLLLAYPLRELLVRGVGLRGALANWLPVSLILAASTCFEIIEAVVAEIVNPGTGPSWLGAQGDEWDAQLDMGSALLGATLAMLVAWAVTQIHIAGSTRAGAR
jgi:putative membrane protein